MRWMDWNVIKQSKPATRQEKLKFPLELDYEQFWEEVEC